MNIEEVEFYVDENGEVQYRKIVDEKNDIETTCLACGFTENVPDFIYDEMSRKKYHLKIRKKVSTLACQKCFKETAISSYWLKNDK